MSFKDQGNQAFKEKKFDEAIAFYTKATEENPQDHTILGNRAAAFQNLGKYGEAEADADKCIEINPAWSKGYQRKGMALHSLRKYDDAIKSYEQGVELDASNAQCKASLEKAIEDQAKSLMQGMGGMGGGMGGMGGGMPGMGGMGGGMPGMGGMGAGGNPLSAENLERVKSVPRIAEYFKDPQFANTFEMVKQQPQMLMQMVQMDPRYMDIFKELTGIDIGGMQEDAAKNKSEDEDRSKMFGEMRAKEEAEADARAKVAEEAALPSEEKLALMKKKEAVAKKDEGNAAYKAKNFEEARALYQAAIDMDPAELLFYTNMAAVHMAEKNFDLAIAECDKAIELTKGCQYDFVKLGKALARKAKAQAQKGDHEQAIQTYKVALLEDNIYSYRDEMKKVEKMKTDAEAKAYLSPEKAEECKEAGNLLFKASDFPGAIKAFNDGIRRDPKNISLYSNRAYAYIKLMEPVQGLKDAEKCIEMDPNFVKAYARKGTCHHLMKEYHKAMPAFEKGLTLDPTNKDCLEGKMKTMTVINSSAHASGGNDDERMRHAMADPEIQQIMMDPRIQQVLKDMNENPAEGQKAMRDPNIAANIQKLIAAGVLKMA